MLFSTNHARMSLFSALSIIALILICTITWNILDIALNTYKKIAKSSDQTIRKMNVKRYDKTDQIAISKPTKISRSSQIQAQTNPILEKLMIGYYLFKANMETVYDQQAITANEKIAINILTKYAKAQDQYFAHYGYYCDRPDNLIIEGENKYTIIDPDLGILNSANSPKTAANGYYYVQTNDPASISGKAQEYRLNAMPAEYGQSGINTFCINQKGNILQENNGAKPIYQPKALDQTNQEPQV